MRAVCVQRVVCGVRGSVWCAAGVVVVCAQCVCRCVCRRAVVRGACSAQCSDYASLLRHHASSSIVLLLPSIIACHRLKLLPLYAFTAFLNQCGTGPKGLSGVWCGAWCVGYARSRTAQQARHARW